MSAAHDATHDTVRDTVRTHYAALADGGSCCGAGQQKSSLDLGYDGGGPRRRARGADLGLGCGNPLAIAALQPGETVLDLGAGGGIDCFLAARAGRPDRPRHRRRHDARDGRRKARANARRRGGYATSSSASARSSTCPSPTRRSTSSSRTASSTCRRTRRAVFREAFRVLQARRPARDLGHGRHRRKCPRTCAGRPGPGAAGLRRRARPPVAGRRRRMLAARPASPTSASSRTTRRVSSWRPGTRATTCASTSFPRASRAPAPRAHETAGGRGRLRARGHSVLGSRHGAQQAGARPRPAAPHAARRRAGGQQRAAGQLRPRAPRPAGPRRAPGPTPGPPGPAQPRARLPARAAGPPDRQRQPLGAPVGHGTGLHPGAGQRPGWARGWHR